MRLAINQPLDAYSDRPQRHWSKTTSLTLGVLIAALNGLFWVGVAASTYWLLGHAQSPLVLAGIWMAATYFSMFAIVGVSARSRDDATSVRAQITSYDDAYEPDAVPPRRHSTR